MAWFPCVAFVIFTISTTSIAGRLKFFEITNEETIMGRSDKSLLEALALLPWWVSVVLSATVYIIMKYIIPLIAFNNIVFKVFAQASPNIAFILALFLLMPVPISAFNSWHKSRLLDSQKDIDAIRSLHWKTFEELINEAYRRQGYSVSANPGKGSDGGIDLTLRRNGETVLVQCKHWKAYKVDVKVVRELYGLVVAENASKGIVVTSGTFTQPAKDFAKDKPIELIDSKALVRLIDDVQKGVTSKSPEHNQPEEVDPVLSEASYPACPKCDSDMILRTATRGARAGTKFWGCSKFPGCRGTRQYN